MHILQAIRDPNVFGPFFRGSTWDTWLVFLAVLFGLPLTSEQVAVRPSAQRRPRQSSVLLTCSTHGTSLISHRRAYARDYTSIGFLLGLFSLVPATILADTVTRGTNQRALWGPKAVPAGVRARRPPVPNVRSPVAGAVEDRRLAGGLRRSQKYNVSSRPSA
jgi:hypothetical protein